MVICSVDEGQVPHSPEVGFLYPAFTNGSTDINHVNFYSQDYEEARELMKFFGFRRWKGLADYICFLRKKLRRKNMINRPRNQ